MPDAADLGDILRKGGEGRIALLQYCAMSINMEPVLVFLCSEFRLRPTHAGALALFDMFCAPGAPAQIRAPQLLPPRDLRLATAIGILRRQWAQMQLPEPPPEDEAIAITVPQRNLFDYLVNALQNDRDGHLQRIGAQFDPALTPRENLPGGSLNEVQRNFIENVWRPVVKPRLAAAGFWQISNIE